MIPPRRIVLLPIRPQHADRILAGQKHFELRKQLPTGPIDTVYLFVSGGEGVPGCFDVSEVLRQDKQKLWEAVGTKGTTRARFDRYFARSENGIALQVIDPVRFAPAVKAAEVRALWPRFKPFNGGQVVPEESPLYARLEGERERSRLSLLPELALRPVVADEMPTYAQLVTDEIRVHYDDIDESFAEMNLRIHTNGEDASGYITDRKEVLAVEWNRVVVGFTTLTFKHSGCAKSGPTILLPEFRRRGLGQSVRRAIERRLVLQRCRKVYCTCPDSAVATLSYLLKSGLRVEAHLERHYSRTHGEFILGKFLELEQADQFVQRDWPLRRGTVRQVKKPDIANVAFAYSRMFSETFFQFDAKSVAKLLGLSLRPSAGFGDKPRFFTYATNRGAVIAIATAIPKRGGAMRLVILRETSEVGTLSALIDDVVKRAAAKGIRKVTATVPVSDGVLVRSFYGRDFRSEGVLRAPYRSGQDVVLMSRFTE